MSHEYPDENCMTKNLEIVSTDQINDPVLRRALLNRISSEGHRANTRIVEELGLRNGLVRIDVAVINSRIHGYEIKSNSDSLSRLHNQAMVYNDTLDQITIVVGEKHFHEVLNVIPDWWGVLLGIKSYSRRLQIIEVRKAGDNPNLNIRAYVELLWRNEALGILEDFQLSKGVKSKSKDVLYERLSSRINREELKRLVLESIKSRKDWRSGAQHTINGD